MRSIIVPVAICASVALSGIAHAPPARGQDVLERPELLGDAFGLRDRLERNGIAVRLGHVAEIWTNPVGGVRRGTALGSLVQADIVLDTEQAGLWQGGTVQISGLHVGGRFPSADLIGNLQAATSIEAARGTYLSEAWVEQAIPGGAGSLRLGQLRADAEFLASGYTEDEGYANASSVFTNASFGFPVLSALALPAGGPAYPLGTPGVRLRLAPPGPVSAMVGVFNGTPASSAFTFRGNMLVMAEVRFAHSQEVDDAGMPGTYRLGAWHHTGRFDHQRFDAMGRSLADPFSNGVARGFRGHTGVYLMADQLLWQTGTLRAEAVGVFARVVVAPADRSSVDMQVDGGITWKGMLAARPDDAFGLGVSWARIGRAAQGLDRDAALFGGAPLPVRSSETVIEATYRIAVAGWWQVQPSVQYIVRPGGGVADPNRPGAVLRDAVVLGIRSTIAF